jgi:hypothetical protein
MSSLIVLVILGGIGFFAIREGLLIWGVAKVRTSLNQLKSIDRNRQTYLGECRKQGAELNENTISRLQLRFLNNHEYVLEVICAQFQLTPIQISEMTLPPFVTKVAGSAGVIWGDEQSGVVLQVWGRKRAVLVEQRELLYETPEESLNFSYGPTTTCEGYGFQCCQEETSQGAGDQFSGVSDCPRSCYSACSSRPIVLSFTSDPFMDPETRTARIKNGETVSFNYVVDSQNPLTEVRLVYGDGQTEFLPDKEGNFTHTYACSTSSCQYEVFLTATDATNATAAITPVTRLSIIVE